MFVNYILTCCIFLVQSVLGSWMEINVSYGVVAVFCVRMQQLCISDVMILF